ncbi:MAG: SsrA-binding protein SmpB [Spirochaetia bacterium]|jgi:SsrA-binding protein|nr:SsrA-binding protein SmpB [Spirochaetia bacterium]
MTTDQKIKVLSVNRKARFNYIVEESLECGIVLKGTEVKSLRMNKFSYSDAYCKIVNGELWLSGFHISPYDFGNINNHDPDRDRKLLANRVEIKKLSRKVSEKGFTLVPLKVYLKNGKVKLEIGICKGKKVYDKRESIKERDVKRETSREMKNS